jgi:hypothetical protein
MLKRALFLFVIVLSVGVVLAQDDGGPNRTGLMSVNTGEDDYGWVLAFRDGRLNNFDLSAPVAIYYSYETIHPTTGPTYTLPTGIQLLAIEPVTNNGQEVFTVPVEEIRHVIDEHLLGEDGVIYEQNGYSLHYAEPGWFWVAAPPDREGKVYSFVWPDVVVHP